MKRPIDTTRLDRIMELLLAIAEGDFTYQIDRSQEDDEIESLVVVLNWLTEEMNESLQFFSSLNTRGNVADFVHIFFVLDHNFNLIQINNGALIQLGISRNVLDTPFSNLLSKESQKEWQEISHTISQQQEFIASIKFQFNSDSPLKKMFLCNINTIPAFALGHKLVVINSFQAISKQKLLEDEIKMRKIQELFEGKIPKPKPKIMLTNHDVEMAQKVRDYILTNLHKPLPSIQELAHIHGTNDFKLKKVFSQFYNISIFRYYTEERVKRAALHLKNTRLSIQEISDMSGFTNTTHFSTAFKKYYSVSPTKYRKLYNRNFK